MMQRLFDTVRRPALGLAVSAALLAGCGGGGSAVLPQHSTVAASTATAAPFSTPAPVHTAAPAATRIAVRIMVPAALHPAGSARRPRYVSVNTQSASIAIDGGAPVVADLAPNSPSCTPAAGGGRTCSISANAPVGRDTFTERTFASTDGSGPALSETTTQATIVAGQANTISLTLGGVVAAVSLSLAQTAPPSGSAATIPLSVTIADASGAAIIGGDPLTSPVTLTDSDTSGATTLSKTTLNAPSDAAGITVGYNGAVVDATFGATAANLTASNVTPATLSPIAAQSTAFVDWPTYAFDSQRSGYNPATTGITPASISRLHIAWQGQHSGQQTQPIVITNVAGHSAIVVVANFAIAQAFDALNGSLVWQRTLPTQDVQDCGIGGIAGTMQYDRALGALFMAAGSGAGAPNHVLLYRLDAATGSITGQVDITPTLLAGEANYGHTAITLANGLVYAGTGSDCEGTDSGQYVSWRGRVVAVDPSSMTLTSTFFTTWQAGPNPDNIGGGGVWGWGGVSADTSGNIYAATGNAETNAATAPQSAAAPFTQTTNEQAGYAENLVQLNGNLSSVEAAKYPGFNFTIGNGDLDFSGTPVIYTPPLASGCGQLAATQGKGGTLVINSTQGLGELSSFALSIPSSSAYYIGNPAYSPQTGLLYAAITSAGNGSSLLPPGLAAIGGCGSSIAWHAQFGPDSTMYIGENPRSAPTVTAGGVVFMGTPCSPDGNGGCGAAGGTPSGALWAIDAASGSVLNGGKPLLITPDNIRMAPSADGLWLWLYDDSGNLYGLTVDPSVPATAAQAGRRVTHRFRARAS